MRSFKLFKKYFLSQRLPLGPVQQTDFSMYLEDFDYGDYKKQLGSFDADLRVIQTNTYKNCVYETFQLELGSKNSARKLLLFAGTHGNEFVPCLAIIDLLKQLQDNPALYAGWTIRIITPVNPVGLVHQSRYDQNGKDINRDFKNFETNGASLQKDAMEEFNPDIIVSMHEGPQDGFFTICDGKLPDGLHNALAEDLKINDIKLARKNFFGLNIANGFWRKPQFVYTLQKILRVYTLGRYAKENGYTLLTTESDWSNKNIEARKTPHLSVIKSTLKHLKDS